MLKYGLLIMKQTEVLFVKVYEKELQTFNKKNQTL